MAMLDSNLDTKRTDVFPFVVKRNVYKTERIIHLTIEFYPNKPV